MSDLTVRATTYVDAMYSPTPSPGRRAAQIVAAVLLIGGALCVVVTGIVIPFLHDVPGFGFLALLTVPLWAGVVLAWLSGDRLRHVEFQPGEPVVTVRGDGITVNTAEPGAATQIAWSRGTVRIKARKPGGEPTPTLRLRNRRSGVWLIPLDGLDADRDTLTAAVRDLSRGRVLLR